MNGALESMNEAGVNGFDDGSFNMLLETIESDMRLTGRFSLFTDRSWSVVVDYRY